MNPHDEIITACSNGELDRLKKVITPENVNCRRGWLSCNLITAVEMCAFRENRFHCLTWLIEEMHADIGFALHEACRGGNLRGIKYLVETCKVDINSVDDEKHTPLYYARFKYPVVMSLLRANALPVEEEMMIDLLCTAKPQYDVIYKLIDHGARVPPDVPLVTWAYERMFKRASVIIWTLYKRGAPKDLAKQFYFQYMLL